jgi:hypothetical protein
MICGAHNLFLYPTRNVGRRAAPTTERLKRATIAYIIVRYLSWWKASSEPMTDLPIPVTVRTLHKRG